MIVNTSLRKKKKKKKQKCKKKKQTSKKLDKKEPPKKLTKDVASNFIEWVNEKEADINSGIFQRYFKFQRPSDMLKSVYKINDKKNDLVNVIRSGLNDLKREIENMGEEEKKFEKPDEIVNIVEEILEFNKQNQSGQGLKILTPDQMLSRLPITLAQLKAGNNFEKLINEIRQLLHSLYRSKNLSKRIYNHLIKTI